MISILLLIALLWQQDKKIRSFLLSRVGNRWSGLMDWFLLYCCSQVTTTFICWRPTNVNNCVLTWVIGRETVATLNSTTSESTQLHISTNWSQLERTVELQVSKDDYTCTVVYSRSLMCNHIRYLSGRAYNTSGMARGLPQITNKLQLHVEWRYLRWS